MAEKKPKEPEEAVELKQGGEEQDAQPLSPESIQCGEDVFSDVKPLNEVAFFIMTPTGKIFKGKTKYVGLHSNNLMLLEPPNASPKELAVFFSVDFLSKLVRFLHKCLKLWFAMLRRQVATIRTIRSV
ncbi:hypothetical protein [Vibrio sp.]|uniref:hypothetical protein n=1 Tax=Vibrio sp. TaxID=678 RepID=UPI00311FCAEE